MRRGTRLSERHLEGFSEAPTFRLFCPDPRGVECLPRLQGVKAIPAGFSAELRRAFWRSPPATHLLAAPRCPFLAPAPPMCDCPPPSENRRGRRTGGQSSQ